MMIRIRKVWLDRSNYSVFFDVQNRIRANYEELVEVKVLVLLLWKYN